MRITNVIKWLLDAMFSFTQNGYPSPLLQTRSNLSSRIGGLPSVIPMVNNPQGLVLLWLHSKQTEVQGGSGEPHTPDWPVLLPFTSSCPSFVVRDCFIPYNEGTECVTTQSCQLEVSPNKHIFLFRLWAEREKKTPLLACVNWQDWIFILSKAVWYRLRINLAEP